MKLTKEHENMIRVCTRDYMDKTNEWPKLPVSREKTIIHGYKTIERVIDRYEETEARQVNLAVRKVICDEWVKHE